MAIRFDLKKKNLTGVRLFKRALNNDEMGFDPITLLILNIRSIRIDGSAQAV